MAWIDDRIWCHPKLTDISDKAFRVWVNSVAYSTGFGTRGVLSVGQQKRVGSNVRIRSALIAAELWDELPEESVRIHDWDVHNSKRDARREADRERKKRERAAKNGGQSDGTSAGASAGQSTGSSCGTSTVSARAEGSEGSDGSEETQGLTTFSQLWLSCAPPLTKHRDAYFAASPLRSALRTALKVYELDAVCEAVRNYAAVVASEAHWFEYRWPAAEFLRRGIDKFVDEAQPLSNYRRTSGSQRGMTFEQILNFGKESQNEPQRSIGAGGVVEGGVS